ncbi:MULTISPECIES: CIA30 family protein [Prochlorococcus]|uniref:NAD dependent epimerase/dehydratase n=1 Tax=Prochlorococcus marinus (strain SARG / CCMP1375 / SS120) TaxID=167539 RepID=Q7VC97_PROMA|nr:MULTISPECIES: CIA30 family protein [Prochlorococcus]AAP99889.1 NAD dependent epimerase/dehydratase [Prochlorococcus marinus subsp. marinus str. CCMP1375]KGG11764.1 NAD dependent epimerase/dehydratase [Prochlorococcus marinus str. LG]KGG18822.1 NAD dependent epimerase/dehydratase [Prochlorococcus marinus str. SS2]KGG23640.1 NAD dependent epimerase/dehydratase [Prochlorococcus marinus str. SS35]KGG32124.1 NAD dependent epimerase/dehydratase [Prochlorococcus marinus str. SS51]
MVADALLIASSDEFSNWMTINDTIMGGSSTAVCQVTSKGLSLEGDLIEENGGFVSCRSPALSPPLDLSAFLGIQLDVEGQGRTLKFAISCGDGFTRVTDYLSGGLRWVAEFKTLKSGITQAKIPFDSFKPTIRARPVRLPIKFSANSISQFQLLHSKFGADGNSNLGFRAGKFLILIHSISAYS